MTPRRVLIVDNPYTHTGYSGARGFAQAGWFVGSASPRPGILSWSSAGSRWHRVPAPEDGLDPFLEALERAILEGGYNLVLGSGDAEVMAVSAGRERLSAMVPYPDHEAVTRLFDKLDITLLARDAGLDAPVTVEAGDPAAADLDLPVVVKSRLHWDPATGAKTVRHPTLVCATASERDRAVAAVRAAGGVPILQEVVDGPVLSYAFVAGRDQRIIARTQSVAHRLCRGTPAFATTERPSETLTAGMARLCEAIGWWGLAQVDFMIRPNGSPACIDFNARPYMSMAMLLKAGPNMSAIWGAVALGDPHPALSDGRAGIRYQWFEGDLQRALRDREGGLLHDVGRVLRASIGARQGVLSTRDLPAALRHDGRVLLREAKSAKAH